MTSAIIPVVIVRTSRSGSGQAVHDAEDELAEHDDREQPEPLDQRLRRRQAEVQADRGAPDQHDAHDPGDDDAGPHDESWVDREEGAGEHHDRRHAHGDHVAPGDGEELGVVPAVLTPDAVPQPRRDGQERGVDEGEATPAAPAASAVNTASRTSTPIWTKTMVRVRPSSRPWSSR